MQYSLHYQKDINSNPEHFEFLGNAIDAPRETLLKQMIKDLSPVGSILVYSLQFERRRLEELARDFPHYASDLTFIIDRLVDLAIPYRKHISTEATKRKWSLKIVMPTFLPHKTYGNLDIQDGMAAMDAYRSLAQLNDTEKKDARQAMLAYCKLDTEAVLELYEKLFELSDA